MAKRSVGNTALGAAVCRLIEQYQPEPTRLFNDPVVKGLVAAPIRLMAQISGTRSFIYQQTEASLKGLYGAQISRTRYIDDAVLDALSQGITQVVILGAGFDTRAYRLPGIERARVFEVDLPSVQNEKKKGIQKHFGRLPENVTFVPIDFDTQILEAVFAGTAFDRSQPTVFVWEGVTQYLSEESFRQTLAFVGSTAPGSILLFTYVLKSVIERRSNITGANRMLDRVADNGSPWTFGMEPSSVQAYLEPFHLDLIEDVGSAEYQDRYFRPANREIAITEVERAVRAVVRAD